MTSADISSGEVLTDEASGAVPTMLRGPATARKGPRRRRRVHSVTSEVVADIQDSDDDDSPRSVGRTTSAVVVEYTLATLTAVNLVVALRMLLDWGDLLSFVVLFLVSFICFHYALVRQSSTKELAADRMTTTLIWVIGALVVASLMWIFGFVALKGVKQLRPGFLVRDMRTAGPNTPGGGVLHSMVGSFEQVGIAAAFAIPVSILTAVYLHELEGRMARAIRFIVEGLAGLPSIVAGLLIFSIWPRYAGIHAAEALAILMIPTVTRTSEEILRTVPDSLREAALALGAPQWRVVTRVVLPTAKSGLLTASILGIARAIGETAPVLLTAFDSKFMNKNPLKEPQSSLPTFAYGNIRTQSVLQNDRAWAAALLLLLFVLVLFTMARWIGARGAKRLGRN